MLCLTRYQLFSPFLLCFLPASSVKCSLLLQRLLRHRYHMAFIGFQLVSMPREIIKIPFC
ncbi:hypothetical protein PF002_g5894 [Phytophthora fragariae]|uniref:Uncharacterized protein n=1 Tax=Phytophthora fragariae TaxID=53985 RepID=A0A6A4A2P9_9STRA|nr:hypothetical protein PF003_g40692 [Phytophthora fragariae]KAE8944507.1 hypothetical protein PF009_g5812 [Phytophthora fragariae]KAE9130124.1 hypothetical protein PF007_g4642 [Phytophthora fragariae]KAE9145412.1 hypothetical protein PF006_g9717 [Phytophthora fragariae]KAE9248224.1 hypothetical protein PF002_g5894 [Phytophthora fragariae]